MCLFKKEESKEAKKLNSLVVGGIIAIVLAIALPFILNPGADLLTKFALAQLAISGIGFIVILVTLDCTIVQFRKSMAKPLIKVAFNEKGDQDILIHESKLTAGLPSLWLINKGNAIARYFQIDFVIPENIGKQSKYISISRNDGKYIVPYTNDGKYTLFVNKPYLDPTIVCYAAIDTTKVDEDSFEIKYRIYGDWAEIQEGKLKININKLQEGS